MSKNTKGLRNAG